MINLLSSMNGFLLAAEFTDFSDLIKDLYSMLWGPLMGIFVGAAALWGLWVGSRFIFAGGDEQKLKKAKDHLKYFAIGIVVIFVIAAGLPLIVAAFQNWMAG